MYSLTDIEWMITVKKVHVNLKGNLVKNIQLGTTSTILIHTNLVKKGPT